MFVNHSEFV